MVLNYILLERNLKKICLYPQIFNLQFLCVAGYLKHSNENIDSSNDKYTNYNRNIKLMFYAFLFNIRNYSPNVTDIQRHAAELNIILLRVINFNIKQKRPGIFVLLYTTYTKQDLGR